MKYPLVVKESLGLVQAREEFQKFRNELRSSNVLVSAANVPQDGAPLLYCARKPGQRSRLHFRALSSEALISGAVRIAPARPSTRAGASVPAPGAISRRLEVTESYDGCPHCGHRGFLLCGRCGALACWDGRHDDRHPCPCCGSKAPIDERGIDLKFEEARHTGYFAEPPRRAKSAPSTRLLLTYDPTKRLR